MIEGSDPRAEPLSEVVSFEEEDPDLQHDLAMNLGPQGKPRLQTGMTSVSLPEDTENLRHRITLCGTS